jgi:hypothetical protein
MNPLAHSFSTLTRRVALALLSGAVLPRWAVVHAAHNGT